jgi:hypothetical protein
MNEASVAENGHIPVPPDALARPPDHRTEIDLSTGELLSVFTAGSSDPALWLQSAVTACHRRCRTPEQEQRSGDSERPEGASTHRGLLGEPRVYPESLAWAASPKEMVLDTHERALVAAQNGAKPRLKTPTLLDTANHPSHTGDMLFMVIETFKGGDPGLAGERFHRMGRMLPEGVIYEASWLESPGGARCWQVMQAPDRATLDVWIARWSDLMDFEVVTVATSKDFWAQRQA